MTYCHPAMPPPQRFLVERPSLRRFPEEKAERIAREIVPHLERAGIHRGTPRIKPAAGGFFYVEVEPDLDGQPITVETLARWLEHFLPTLPLPPLARRTAWR